MFDVLMIHCFFFAAVVGKTDLFSLLTQLWLRFGNI